MVWRQPLVESKKPVRTVLVEARCECGGVFERADDVVLTTFPAQYSYICSCCKKKATFCKQYPYIDYEGIKND